MASDFVVVLSRPQHFGSNQGYFGDEAVFDSSRIPDDLVFAGRTKEFSFGTPELDTQSPGILMLELFDANLTHNEFQINGRPIAGGFPVSSRRGEWSSHVRILDPGHLRADGANEFAIAAGPHGGRVGGNRDNFIVNSVVVMYRLVTPGQ